jgi:predicted SAM-dependent methyltransferase
MNIVPEHKKLNIGCGFKKLVDHWNVDAEARCNPDQIVDLEETPWPWEDNFFDRINADNVLEHLGQNPKQFTNIMKEMYRISKDGAEWYINVPHHRCDLFWDDYTHVRIITPKTLKMFDQSVNVDSIRRKLSDSVFGLVHGIDIEVTDTTYNMVGYWLEQQSLGMLAPKQFEINLNTLANVAESVNIFITVHKPGRFENYLQSVIQAR